VTTQRGDIERPDQLSRHTLDVTQNAFTRASVEGRNEAVDAPKSALPEMFSCSILEQTSTR
jgi:hypothetical protein